MLITPAMSKSIATAIAWSSGARPATRLANHPPAKEPPPIQWGKANNTTMTIERINANNIDTRLAAAVQSQSGPDVFQHNLGWPWCFADQLVDASDVVKELGDKQGGWHEVMQKYNQVESTYLGIPLSFVPNAFVYRKSMWQAAGVSAPKTWDDFVAAPLGVTSELIRSDVFFWGSLMAGALLGSVAVAVLYSFFVEYFVAGLTAGAVKG